MTSKNWQKFKSWNEASKIDYEESTYIARNCEITSLPNKFNLVVDRIVTADDEDYFNRLSSAIEAAFFEGKRYCIVRDLSTKDTVDFSNLFALVGQEFTIPSLHLFSFNNP